MCIQPSSLSGRRSQPAGGTNPQIIIHPSIFNSCWSLSQLSHGEGRTTHLSQGHNETIKGQKTFALTCTQLSVPVSPRVHVFKQCPWRCLVIQRQKPLLTATSQILLKDYKHPKVTFAMLWLWKEAGESPGRHIKNIKLHTETKPGLSCSERGSSVSHWATRTPSRWWVNSASERCNVAQDVHPSTFVFSLQHYLFWKCDAHPSSQEQRRKGNSVGERLLDCVQHPECRSHNFSKQDGNHTQHCSLSFTSFNEGNYLLPHVALRLKLLSMESVTRHIDRQH